jgi:outer membrane translocation and assembly module TamA
VRGVFGQRLTHAGGEWRYWLTPTLRALHLAPAVFVDLARAFDVPQFGDGRTHADVGVGLRVAVPGAGVLRVDLARGLRDGATTLSLGWWR